MDTRKKELSRAYDRLAYWAGRVRELQFGRAPRKPQRREPRPPAAQTVETRP